MKETILITGAGPNGVTGKRIKEYFQNNYDYKILSPSSKDLDLTNFDQVTSFFRDNNIDYVIHSAVVAPSRGHDNSDYSTEIESNLRMFLNLKHQSNKYKKLFYIGSGAEFDKSLPIIDVKEASFPLSIPSDKYGFAKYILNIITQQSDHIYNLRVFGTINPYEPKERNVVSRICSDVAAGQTIKLNRNCNFSFIDVDDIARFIKYGIENNLKFKDYNMIGYTGEIRDIANLTRTLLFPNLDIDFSESGYNNEYTGNGMRLTEENFITTPIKESLAKVLSHYGENDLEIK